MSSSEPNIPPTSRPSKLPRPATASSPPSTAHPFNDTQTTFRRRYQHPATKDATSQPPKLLKRTLSSPPSTAHPPNDAQKPPRRHSLNDMTVRDDPFFSHELFSEMLKSRPDIAHVGLMYTRAQEREFDEYYERVMGRRGTLEEPRVRDSERSPDDALVCVRTKDGAPYGWRFGRWCWWW